MVGKLLSRALGAVERRRLRALEVEAGRVNALEHESRSLSDSALAAKTAEFRHRLDNGEALDDLLYEAFAVVREVAERTVSMRHFDVQVVGGIVLHRGKIAEMKTGEGKTLVATLPVYLNVLSGRGVHVVTVNDYLARRDAEWMGPIYRFLGLDVGVLQNQMPQAERRAAYAADVTYGTNSEFGFDYLRDNMAIDIQECVQRGHYYTIIDEVDSILIDEARTPLIISGPSERSADLYRTFARMVPRLSEGADYEVDHKTRTVTITEDGVAQVERLLDVDNLYDPSNIQMVNHLNQALKAHALFKSDVDYIIKDGEVIIVDEFTGRLMHGRRYSEGLHQAIEAKEGVHIREENQTLATVTLQNYFRMYEKLAGMTGTAATEAEEFMHIYKLEVIAIPTNRPMIRADMPDVIYKTEDAKYRAVVDDIASRFEAGQPVLVGTISIEKSERLSQLLSRRGIQHEVLNAKHHEREAHIIAQAGRRGAVTVATNMAGRGVDIILGGNPANPEDAGFVKEVGGLYVLGTERHEARRIDNQLRGRSGRQGDSGLSHFYISLEDDLMRAFGYEKVARLMERLGLPEDIPIEHPLISKTIETAQRQIESQNFNIRKHLLEYDDVLNAQRKAVYKERRRLLENEDAGETIDQYLDEISNTSVASHTAREIEQEEWDYSGLASYLGSLLPDAPDESVLREEGVTQEALVEVVQGLFEQARERKRAEFGVDTMREVERLILLRVVDYWWREHLYDMDYLREGISLRAYGQRDPLVEYKREAFDLFDGMQHAVKEDTLRYLFHVEVVPQLERAQAAVAGGGGSHAQTTRGKKVGRNEPCPCGSGKKYKKCCGRDA